MNIFLFVVCVLVAVSAAFILTTEYIFSWLRNLILRWDKKILVEFIFCPVCVSWWVGLAVGLIACGVSWWVFGVAFVSALLARIIRIFED